MQRLLFFSTLAILLLASLRPAQAQGYCQCGKRFQYDPTNLCLTSASYNVQNSCYVCPVINASGEFHFCDSLYGLGFGDCAQSGALAARQAACTAFGGNIAASAFQCLNSAGTNQSQVIACTTPSAPPTTAPPTSSAAPTLFGAPPTSGTTAAPTNPAGRSAASPLLLLLAAPLFLL